MTKSEVWSAFPSAPLLLAGELVLLDLVVAWVHPSNGRRESEDGLLFCFEADLVTRSVTLFLGKLVFISSSEDCISISFSVLGGLDVDGSVFVGSVDDDGGMTP